MAAGAIDTLGHDDGVDQVFPGWQRPVNRFDEFQPGRRVDHMLFYVGAIKELRVSLIAEKKVLGRHHHDATWPYDAGHLPHGDTGLGMATEMLDRREGPRDVEALVVVIAEIGPIHDAKLDCVASDRSRAERLRVLQNGSVGFATSGS